MAPVSPMPARRLDDVALDRLFREARSFNRYTETPVTEEQIGAIWDLMKWGPTSANQLPARLVWCMSTAAKRKLADCCKPQNVAKVLGAPVVVIIGMDYDFHEHLPDLFPHTDARAWFAHDRELRKESAFRNASMQGAYLILAARALGLDTGPISGFDNDAVNAAFFAGRPTVTSNFICTLGIGDPESVFGRLPRPDFARFNEIL